jgi:hypothetical protein
MPGIIHRSIGVAATNRSGEVPLSLSVENFPCLPIPLLFSSQGQSKNYGDEQKPTTRRHGAILLQFRPHRTASPWCSTVQGALGIVALSVMAATWNL